MSEFGKIRNDIKSGALPKSEIPGFVGWGFRKLAWVFILLALLIFALTWLILAGRGQAGALAPEAWSSLNQLIVRNEAGTHGNEVGLDRAYYRFTVAGVYCYGYVVQRECIYDAYTGNFDSVLDVYYGDYCVDTTDTPPWPQHWYAYYTDLVLTTRYGSGSRIYEGDEFVPKLIMYDYCSVQALANTNGDGNKKNVYVDRLPILKYRDAYP